MKVSSRLLAAALAALFFVPTIVSGQVVINEFLYDDLNGADDKEFIELYNAGLDPVDLGNWTLGGYDPGNVNLSTMLPVGASIGPGQYYVIGNAGVANVNHIVAGGFLENDNETIVLRDASSALIDAVAYETNKGVGFVGTGATGDPAVAAQVGPGIFGNHQGVDIEGPPLNITASLGRFVNGRDTNNNGRDFGLRPGTPGATNSPGGNITSFVLPDPAPMPTGSLFDSLPGSFVGTKVIEPALPDGVNPYAISEPYGPGSKAYIAWDPSGGGNCVTSTAVFSTKQAGFSIRAYLETATIPPQFNNANPPVGFRGSEITLYGIGGGDALCNLTDLDGSIGIGAATPPLTDTANGFTGIAWIYERVGEASVGGPTSRKLYLVDANDSGDSDLGGNTPMDWQILAMYDLGAAPPGWHDLSIQIDSQGNGVAKFDGQATNFTAPDLNGSAFNVGYRENLQLFADTTPDNEMRPATFTISLPPVLGELTIAFTAPSTVTLSIPATAGQTIGAQYSPTMAAGTWVDLGDFNIVGSTGTFTDTDPVRTTLPRGFYRAFLR